MCLNFYSSDILLLNKFCQLLQRNLNMAAAGEDFDAKKELAVESMTKGEFQRWLMEQDSLVKYLSTKFGVIDNCLFEGYLARE